MFSKKSIELRDKYLKEVDRLLPKVLRNLQRIHKCAMKNGYKLKRKEL